MQTLTFAIFLLLASNEVAADNFVGSKSAKSDVSILKFNFGNSSYEISSYEANWFIAKNACKSSGQQLVSIESLEENSAILEAIALVPNESFWTAGCDLIENGNFYWETTGYPIGPFTYWAIGEPNNAGGWESCMGLSGYGNSHLWNDWPCGNVYRFICESRSC